MCSMTEGGIENIEVKSIPLWSSDYLISSLVDPDCGKLWGKPEDGDHEGKADLT